MSKRGKGQTSFKRRSRLVAVVSLCLLLHTLVVVVTHYHPAALFAAGQSAHSVSRDLNQRAGQKPSVDYDSQCALCQLQRQSKTGFETIDLSFRLVVQSSDFPVRPETASSLIPCTVLSDRAPPRD